ncbi:spore gernimation protein GerB [Geobacillus thermodenitrificans]|uniref:GerAB/ArcD/ProY family transporter n=1 Tax=Geobacillus thermodenitrificans TaxID=33940 RepID=A0ABY9QAD8_GEOTD|nr:GerAB/ArcD/ProY family transporter [Geobacillus thermodenitrificans]ATO37944.1 spore gernimation protein GerB [Geobacillus thermodenitrificans]WMV75864.1 GerAB/ArcD/ProY family transporter [Geobacillus thermodenitrificans]
MASVAERLQVSPFMTFFIIMSMQIGIGVLGFQRIIAETAGHDAWISVLLAGASSHLILILIYWLLQQADGDFVLLHQRLFGRWVGGVLSLLLVLYFAIMPFVVLNTYIEVVQVWMFPDLKTWEFSLALFLLCLYITFGGFRIVVGICFFFLIIPSYLVFTFWFVLDYSDFYQLLPIFDHSPSAILKAAKQMTLTMLGYETVLFFYPFIKGGKQSAKWAHAAVLTTTLFYTLLTILTLAYFSENQLQRQIWPTLMMWKVVELPFIERFEYIGIANWLLIILPNICLGLWCSSRICKQLFSIRQKMALLVITTICFFCTLWIDDRAEIDFANTILNRAGFYFLYIWIPCLAGITYIVKKVRGNV